MAVATKDKEETEATPEEAVGAAVTTVLVKIHDEVHEVTEEAFKYLCSWLAAIPTLGVAFHQWVVDEENIALGAWRRVIPADHTVALGPEQPEA